METSRPRLTERECWDYLAGQSVGRLALSLAALPAIVPVQYYLEERTITACLGDHPIPTDAVNGTVLAFAADQVHGQDLAGWCVQVLGTSRLSGGPGAPADCGQLERGRLISIEPASVSGFAIRLCPLLAGPEFRPGPPAP